MMNIFRSGLSFLMALMVAMCGSAAMAELKVRESFDYAPGGDLGNAANGPGETGLTGTWGDIGSGLFNDSDWEVAANSVVYPTNVTERPFGSRVRILTGGDGNTGGVEQAVSASIDFDADGTYYVSFLVDKLDNGSGGDYFWLGLRDADARGTPADNLKAGFGFGSGENILITLEGMGAGENTQGDPIPTGEEVLIVGKIRTQAVSDDVISVNFYPSSGSAPLTEPAWSLQRTNSQSGVADTLLLTSGGNTKISVDELRIGTRYADVIPLAERGLLHYESFDYNAGDDLGNNGNGPGDVGFTGTWGDTGSGLLNDADWDVNAGSLSLPGNLELQSLGNKARINTGGDGTVGGVEHSLSTTVDFDAGGTYYVSFLVNKTDNATGGDYFWLGLRDKDARGTPADDLKAGFGFGSSETLVITLEGMATGENTAGSAITAGADTLIVGKLLTHAGTDDEIFATFYPSSGSAPLTEPAAWTVERTYNQSGVADTFLLTSGGNTVISIDEFRIGRTYLDVIAPQPPSGTVFKIL